MRDDWKHEAIASDVRPTNVSIFYEDGLPFIKYIGTAYLKNGLKVQIEIPKMDLTLSNVTSVRDTEFKDLGGGIKIPVNYHQQMYVVKDNWFTVRPIEREVSKEELEKELGYKLKFKE